MSYVLKQNGEQIAISGGWNPVMFGNHTKTSFPSLVDQSFVWAHDGFDLRWVDDPPPAPPTPEQLQAQVNQESREYLASTDWYVVRFAETGIAIPQEILDARAAARAAIVE